MFGMKSWRYGHSKWNEIVVAHILFNKQTSTGKILTLLYLQYNTGWGVCACTHLLYMLQRLQSCLVLNVCPSALQAAYNAIIATTQQLPWHCWWIICQQSYNSTALPSALHFVKEQKGGTCLNVVTRALVLSASRHNIHKTKAREGARANTYKHFCSVANGGLYSKRSWLMTNLLSCREISADVYRSAWLYV